MVKIKKHDLEALIKEEVLKCLKEMSAMHTGSVQGSAALFQGGDSEDEPADPTHPTTETTETEEDKQNARK